MKDLAYQPPTLVHILSYLPKLPYKQYGKQNTNNFRDYHTEPLGTGSINEKTEMLQYRVHANNSLEPGVW